MLKVFMSYSHAQGEWVHGRLAPCLRAAGAEVLLDVDRFRLGQAVVGQMDALQDAADRHILVLSPEYLGSDYCLHEMKRALKADAKLDRGLVLPLLRVDCSLPKPFNGWNPPLYARFQDDSQVEPWRKLFEACKAEGLGAAAPDWLRARDEVARKLARDESVNLITRNGGNWKDLLADVKEKQFPGMALIDMANPDTMTRRGLLTAICQALGHAKPLPAEPFDLSGFKAVLQARAMTHIAISHFDLANHRQGFDIDFFAALRYFIMEQRKLTVVIQSRSALAALLPQEHPLSNISIASVELQGGS